MPAKETILSNYYVFIIKMEIMFLQQHPNIQPKSEFMKKFVKCFLIEIESLLKDNLLF